MSSEDKGLDNSLIELPRSVAVERLVNLAQSALYSSVDDRDDSSAFYHGGSDSNLVYCGRTRQTLSAAPVATQSLENYNAILSMLMPMSSN